MNAKPKRTFNHDFPFVEIILIGTQFFLLIVSVREFYKKGDSGFIFLAVFIMSGLALIYWLTNWRNKRLYFNENSLIIKPYLNKAETIPYENIEGYLLKETYSRQRTGLDYHIHIISQPSEQLWKLVKNELKGIGFIRYHLILAGK
jgi:hypothetical protein